MAAGTIPPPLIVTSEIGKKLPWDTVFELEAPNSSCSVFYTIDGQRPAVFELPFVYKKSNPGQRNTLLYKGRFWLMGGKRTVKAVCLAPDGRESNVITRVFNIDQAEPDENRLLELNADCADTLMVMQTNPPKKKKVFHEVTLIEHFDEPKTPPKPRCHYCNCEYAITGACRFCTQCSKPIPHYSECEPEQVYQGCNGICPSCSAICPLDATNCPICDIVLPERKMTEEVKVTNQGFLICPKCRHESPPQSKACQRCESVFPLPIMTGQERVNIVKYSFVYSCDFNKKTGIANRDFQKVAY